ncbi:MAG: tetratricopeptide repeat protein [Rubrobacter sp.]|nr:tetratricopeptide repeat protein [Rubrobacter sp.]
MGLFYPTAAALVLLVLLGAFVGRQNRDLLRARAYREFAVRLMPVLSTGVFIVGLPFIADLARVEDTLSVVLVYLAGAAILTSLMARGVAPDERKAAAAFRREDYEEAARIYGELVKYRPLPRYYSALGTVLDLDGEHADGLEAINQAIELDPKLGVAYYNRAACLASLGRKEDAREDLQMVFKVDSARRARRAAEEALDALEGR